jgi:hypothetical protein
LIATGSCHQDEEIAEEQEEVEMGGSSNLETDVSLKANVVSHHARGISLLNHVEPG